MLRSSQKVKSNKQFGQCYSDLGYTWVKLLPLFIHQHFFSQGSLPELWRWCCYLLNGSGKLYNIMIVPHLCNFTPHTFSHWYILNFLSSGNSRQCICVSTATKRTSCFSSCCYCDGVCIGTTSSKFPFVNVLERRTKVVCCSYPNIQNIVLKDNFSNFFLDLLVSTRRCGTKIQKTNFL